MFGNLLHFHHFLLKIFVGPPDSINILLCLVYTEVGFHQSTYEFSTLADLVNVFEVFLPQLLLYPNPSDPLNGEAAALMMRDRAAYDQRVKGINLSKHRIVGMGFTIGSIVATISHINGY